MQWMPSDYCKNMMRAILSMTTDTLLGKGVADKGTFISNLRTYARLMEEEGEPVEVSNDKD